MQVTMPYPSWRRRGGPFREVPEARIKTLSSHREVPSHVLPQHQEEWAKRELAMGMAAELIAKVFEFGKVRRLDYADGNATYFVDLDVIVPETPKGATQIRDGYIAPRVVMRSRYFTPEDPT